MRAAVDEARTLALAHVRQVKVRSALTRAGESIAVRHSDRGLVNTPCTLAGQSRWRRKALVASEPIDDGLVRSRSSRGRSSGSAPRG